MERACFEDPFVESFEAAAKQNQPLARYEVANAGLRQRLAARGQCKHRPAVRHTVERSSDNVRAKDHPRTTTGGSVVNASVPVRRKATDVCCFEGPKAFAKRPPRQARAKRA